MGQLTYNRGTTYTIGVTYSNANNVAGLTLMFTIKTVQQDANSTDTSDANVLLKKDVGMVGNAASVAINPTDIAPTVQPGKYFYDFKVLDTTGAIYLIDSGSFTLKATPTNRLT